jgi:hypothetical protein
MRRMLRQAMCCIDHVTNGERISVELFYGNILMFETTYLRVHFPQIIQHNINHIMI